MNEPNLDRLAGEPRLTVGQRLIKSRKARGWTLGYVSSQLHLPESTVQSLEADDYLHLPAEVYAKGYLRNYARLLRLPPEELVQSYLEQQTSPPSSQVFASSPRPAARPAKGRRPPPPDTRTRPVRARPDAAPEPRSAAPSWLALAVVAAMAAIWWWPDEGIPVAEWTSRVRSVVDALLSPPTEITSDPEETLLQGDADAVSSDMAAATRAEPMPASDPASPEKPRHAEAPAEAETAATPPPATGEPDTLVLRFDGESWATVMDAEGKRLIHQTGVAGSTKVLKGKAPFNLTIGRVNNVSMEFNGRPVVFPNQKNRATERFSLPLTTPE